MSTVNNKFPLFLALHKTIQKVKKERLFSALFLLVSILYFSTRMWNLPYRFGFDFDQELAARTAREIIINHNLTLIGQETSVGGLFVGPYLFYLQSLALLILNFNPLGLAYLSILVGFLTLLMLAFVTSEVFNKWSALIAALIYSISFRIINYDVSANLMSYMMITSLIFFYASYKYFIKRQVKYLQLLAMALGLSLNVHFANILLSTAIIPLYIIYKPKLTRVYLIRAIFIIAFFTLPLVLFEFRHDFMISTNFVRFLSETGQTTLQTASPINVFNSILSDTLVKGGYFNWIPITLIIPISTILLLQDRRKGLLLFMAIFLFTPLLIMYSYKGHVPEYYFLPVLPIFLIIFSYSLYKLWKKYAVIALLVLCYLSIINLQKFTSEKDISGSYAFKNEVVNWVINDAGLHDFNVYYDMPHGLGNGYTYLFGWKGRQPRDFADLLYILKFTDPENFSLVDYEKVYAEKTISLQRFGFMHIVSIK